MANEQTGALGKLKALVQAAKLSGKMRTGVASGDVVRRAEWTPQASKRNPNPSKQTLIEFAAPDRRPFSMGPNMVLTIGEAEANGNLDKVIDTLKLTGGTWNKRTPEQLTVVKQYIGQALALATAILEERTSEVAPAPQAAPVGFSAEDVARMVAEAVAKATAPKPEPGK